MNWLTNNKQAHTRMSECLSSVSDRNVKLMSYATFNNFMNKNAQSKNGLKPSFRKGLQVFLSYHMALATALAANAAAQEADDCCVELGSCADASEGKLTL